jgi:hypothetical protein
MSPTTGVTSTRPSSWELIDVPYRLLALYIVDLLLWWFVGCKAVFIIFAVAIFIDFICMIDGDGVREGWFANIIFLIVLLALPGGLITLAVMNMP